MSSPLGLLLASSESQSEVIVPQSENEVVDQCSHPPFLFAYSPKGSKSTFVENVVPTGFGCDLADDENERRWILV